MGKFIIEGGKLLEGDIAVAGSKNASLAGLAASLLFKDKLSYKNIPEIEDIKRMEELVGLCRKDKKVSRDIAKRFRASILVAGPMLALHRKVTFPHPGGCLIGARPIDVFLDGWRAMGANVEEKEKDYFLEAPNGLHACDYTFRVRSVTGAEGIMMTAVLLQGKTTLRNVPIEPEVVFLEEFISSSGVSIDGIGTNTLIIEGRGGLLDSTIPFVAPPDRIEAGTFLILGALVAKSIRITQFCAKNLEALLSVFSEAGINYKQESENIISISKCNNIKPITIHTAEYPGFATDLQAPITVLATQAKGESIINENIFEGRLQYITDLNRMGANIELLNSQRARVVGSTKLSGVPLESPDLRAGLAFVISALIADNISIVDNVYQIDRGYERIDKRLLALGASIRREN
jgi:UDP-N-acetylglucosamine 1-carboxyvinyltransferase